MIARMILPWFGGTAAVWTVCLLFFQSLLLAGYLYSWWSIRYLTPRRQGVLHAALLAASVIALPITPASRWKPLPEDDPTLGILVLLAVCVGLPYFLLSTTGPLLQAWYARGREGAMPYRLYALSNLGSMLALLSYPSFVEPRLTGRLQGAVWSSGYVLFALLCGGLALSTLKAGKTVRPDGTDRPAYPTFGQAALWVGLTACASALLLAITNHLTQNVAPIPFLWVLPLCLYLGSFILCFDSDRWYRRATFLRLLAVALGTMCYALDKEYQNVSVYALVPLFGGGLFVACMVCHGELARLKPHPLYLTGFYVMCALGGALGGVFVGLISPRLFPGYYELPIALVSCGVLAMAVLFRDPTTPFHHGRYRLGWALLVALALGLTGSLAWQIREHESDARVVARNFYGGLLVSDFGLDEQAERTLTHGTINHGTQFLAPERRGWPTTYYGYRSGVGRAIGKAGLGPRRVGVVGLGAGTLASYGRPGDYFEFYEINPLVIRLANTEFTFLKYSHAHVRVTLGDARLSLERQPPRAFDVLAIDAFSSDSIPVHLLTVEAFRLYLSHIKPGGVLAVHVSNKYLDLLPVVGQAAALLKKPAWVVDTEDEDGNGVFGATWVLLTDREEMFKEPEMKDMTSRLDATEGFRPWTDDYSNLLGILKRP